MAERCGDRQRKFDGLEKWPFRFFIESLPIMLQIALLLLACGLSRYVWSVNTSVARVVISFTVLGLLFYIGIVAAGTSSYECPFQTPASKVLRYLRDSGTTRRLLARMAPSNAISLIYATWVNAQQRFISVSHHMRDTTRHLPSWDISPSRIMPGIQSMATMVGHQMIILLLRIDRASRDAKQTLVQRIRSCRRARILPTTVGEVDQQSGPLRNCPRLLVRVRNVETLRKQNADNMRCVCWVLWNITDPEAIDSAIRLAGTIRWFDGDSNHDPPFDFIVSTFEACFDSTKQLYPGMKDRAYFSARAILQINLGARAQSHEFASKYPIPKVSSNTSQYTDPDICHMIRMLERTFGSDRPVLHFPQAGINTHNHILWVSNLFLDLTRVGPLNPILRSFRLHFDVVIANHQAYFSVAIANHQAMIANTLLMWYMLLGGSVEDETFWATDKSYAVNPLTVLSTHLILCILAILWIPSSLTYPRQ